jgi:hypothetical protein
MQIGTTIRNFGIIDVQWMKLKRLGGVSKFHSFRRFDAHLAGIDEVEGPLPEGGTTSFFFIDGTGETELPVMSRVSAWASLTDEISEQHGQATETCTIV